MDGPRGIGTNAPAVVRRLCAYPRTPEASLYAQEEGGEACREPLVRARPLPPARVATAVDVLICAGTLRPSARAYDAMALLRHAGTRALPGCARRFLMRPTSTACQRSRGGCMCVCRARRHGLREDELPNHRSRAARAHAARVCAP